MGGWCLIKTTKCAAAADPKHNHWLRHGGTWFAGVNILENNTQGAVDGGQKLSGNAVNFVEQLTDAQIKLDKGQISVCYPGYPKPSVDENEAGFKYRLSRDAAHLDGVLKDDGERYLREYHDYILAIPMTDVSASAAPFVVWNGSHRTVHATLQRALANTSATEWSKVPVKKAYQAMRKEIFNECTRVEVPLKVGQVLVAHRLLLHGTATWQENAIAGSDGRMICFFRPATLTINQWLDLTVN